VARDRRRDDPLPGCTDVEVIASGTCGPILGARELETGRPVAAKVTQAVPGQLPPEARALATLGEHPNVVTLHRVVHHDDGRVVLLLDRCDGSLADVLATSGGLPAARVVATGIAIGGALETAHRAGLTHGAIRPSHLLRSRHGEVVLTGFGSEAAPDALTVAADTLGLTSTLAALLGDPPHGPVPSRLAELLRWATAAAAAERPRTPLEVVHHLHEVEREAGWGPTPCHIGGVGPLAPGTTTPSPRRGRAAAVTGLPPLGLRGWEGRGQVRRDR
jgi:eukaryotic-like serine/threonine-protein kinase